MVGDCRPLPGGSDCDCVVRADAAAAAPLIPAFAGDLLKTAKAYIEVIARYASCLETASFKVSR